MKKIFWLLVPIFFLCSCGGSDKSDASNDHPEWGEENTALAEAIKAQDYDLMGTLADSLSYNADLAPRPAIEVLTAYAQICDEQQRKGQSKKVSETMRKFMDVYEISLQINPRDMAAALDASAVNLRNIAADYRAKLDNVDISGVEDEIISDEPEAKPDSLITDTTSLETPVQQPATHEPDMNSLYDTPVE